ncbi:hypothetical protein [Vibrio harveyi]|uniref:hypothetical protein n=2 Tax=Vibrio harveyi TaxID=669 RepID=UPI003BB55B4A
MAKVENPVRGYVSCPVCQSASTVHQCGEGKLIETGETPKNGRNIGILYYRCPECGNSSISKRGSEFISANMVAELSDLKPLEAAPVQVSEPKIEVENETVILSDETEELTVNQVSEAVEETETETVDQTDTKTLTLWGNKTVKRVMMVLLALGFALWVFRKLVNKPQKEGGEHVAA